MGILIDSKGNVTTLDISLNKILFPVQVGKFEISELGEKFVSNSLNENNVNELFNFIPQEMHNFILSKKLIQTRSSIFKSNKDKSEGNQRADASQSPHINEGNELHFFFGGSLFIFFNINDEHLTVIVQKGDWIFIPSNIEHWTKNTSDGFLFITSYHSESFDTFHKKVRYTKTKSNAFFK